MGEEAGHHSFKDVRAREGNEGSTGLLREDTGSSSSADK